MNRSSRHLLALGSAPSPRRRRGAAMVETVLLMVVLLPLFFYALFLMDAAYMKLDLQESVVSSVWDISTLNGEKDTGSGYEKSVKASRASYSDHTSAYEDGAEPGGPGYGDTTRITGNHNHEKHHKIYFAAQYTYKFAGGADTQFECSPVTGNGWAIDPLTLPSFANTYSKTSAVRCSATGYIYNYLLPDKIFETDTVKMSNLTKRDKGTDAHSIQGGGKNIVASEKGSVYFNTWALQTSGMYGDHNMISSYTNLDGAEFYKRVDHVNAALMGTPTFAAVTGAAAGFASAAQQNLKMTVYPGIPMMSTQREIAGLPAIAATFMSALYKPQAPGQTKSPPFIDIFSGSAKFETTPYQAVNTKYRSAYNKRGLYYMGCKTEQKDGACQ
jgi:Flp pilus assembly protein TadG